MDDDGGLAGWRFGRVHFACRFECARDLDTEVTYDWHAGLRRGLVEENVVAVRPQPRLATNELPDLAKGWPPRRANRARRDLAAHHGQLAGLNSLYVDGDGHRSIISRIVLARLSPPASAARREVTGTAFVARGPVLRLAQRGVGRGRVAHISLLLVSVLSVFSVLNPSFSHTATTPP